MSGEISFKHLIGKRNWVSIIATNRVSVLFGEMLINVSPGSDTSAPESAELRSHSDSFHDYANGTPLKLSDGMRVMIIDENEGTNYGEAAYVRGGA